MQDEDNVYRQGGNTDFNVESSSNSGNSFNQAFGNQDSINPALPRENNPISDIQSNGQLAQQTKSINQFPLSKLSEKNETTNSSLTGNDNTSVIANDDVLQDTVGHQGIDTLGTDKNDDNVTAIKPTNLTTISDSIPEQKSDSQKLPVITTKKTKKGKLLKIIIIIILVLAASLGAAAAAYFGYILPNKPENKLSKAFSNTIKQPPMSVKGTMDFKSIANSDSQEDVSFALDYNVSSVGENLSFSGNVGFMGASFPVDFKYIDRDAYVKVGGLNFLSNLYKDTSLSDVNFSEINDKWFVINRSLLQSAEQQTKCSAEDTAMSNSDIEAIEDIYKKHPLFTIESSASDKIDNESVTKMQIKPKDEATANNFVKELGNLDKIKKIKKCISGGSTSNIQSSIDEEILPTKVSKTDSTILIYITSENKIKRIELKASDSEMALDMNMNMDWTPVTITKPDGAKPMQDILPTLMNSYSELSGTGISY